MRSGRPLRRRAPSAQRSEQLAQVRIDSVAAGGAGVGRIESLACFVPRTAPGDVAQVAYVTHARYARGRVLQLIEVSPERVEPRCRHYVQDRCGGCQLQHINATSQRALRQQIVQDALQRMGHRAIERPIVIAGDEWGYRERLTVTLHPAGAGYDGGLHKYDDAGKIFALRECPIADERLVACWNDVRRHLRELPPTSRDSPLRLSLRLRSGALNDVVLVLLGGTSFASGADWASSLRERVSSVDAVWWQPEGGDARLLSGDVEREILAFAQVNADIARALHAHVVESVRAFAPTSVVDAYSGRGDLSDVLARDGVRVSAIEADASATASATRRLAAYPRTQVLTALVEVALPSVLPADVVVLNPPRRGVDTRVCALLADSAQQGVRAIVYVSCDPATLARDLARMPRWRIQTVRCFDMFPQTAHIETVCVLVPEDA